MVLAWFVLNPNAELIRFFLDFQGHRFLCGGLENQEKISVSTSCYVIGHT
jgi:hypothetical protein